MPEETAVAERPPVAEAATDETPPDAGTEKNPESTAEYVRRLEAEKESLRKEVNHYVLSLESADRALSRHDRTIEEQNAQIGKLQAALARLRPPEEAGGFAAALTKELSHRLVECVEVAPGLANVPFVSTLKPLGGDGVPVGAPVVAIHSAEGLMRAGQRFILTLSPLALLFALLLLAICGPAAAQVCECLGCDCPASIDSSEEVARFEAGELTTPIDLVSRRQPAPQPAAPTPPIIFWRNGWVERRHGGGLLGFGFVGGWREKRRYPPGSYIAPQVQQGKPQAYPYRPGTASRCPQCQLR